MIHLRKKRTAVAMALILALGNAFSVASANSKTGFLSRSAPVTISIPSLGVNAKIIGLGLDNKGALDVPKGADVAGWYKGSPSPGEIGPTIVVAHVDMNGKEGVFFHLKDLKIGDLIRLTRGDNKVITFKVDSTLSVLKSKFPSSKIYGNINRSGLRLITCGGTFDSKIGHYTSNIIVFASAIQY